MRVPTLLLLCFGFYRIKAHPLCTDGFTALPQVGINFCNIYSQESCCDGGRDAQLADIVQQLGIVDDTCRNFFKEVVCTECDPWAAHLRGEEPDVKDVPWLCQDYCEAFYVACGSATLASDTMAPFKTTRISDTWPDAGQFCAQFVNSLSWGYCYSGVPYAPAVPPGFSSQDGICLDLVINSPNGDYWIDFVEIPDNTNRVVTISRTGLARIHQKTDNGPFLELGTFLLLQDRVTIRGEGGLLGLAFHRDYAQNRKFYVSYTCDPAIHEDCKYPCGVTADCPTNGGVCTNGFCTNHELMSIVEEYVAQAGNPNLAEPQAVKAVLKVSQPGGNHNGGQILMGPDGYLYVFFGDGGSNGGQKAQDPQSFLGKVLRLDVDTEEPYAIPSDNPFVNDPNKRSEIWALGFRNPWRNSFDSFTGELWMGDVGQDTVEEVNLITAGSNYGWRKYEGSINREALDDEIPNHVLPEFSYGHDATAGSEACVIGGVVYRGLNSPCHNGEYLFADLDGYLFSATKNGSVPGTWTQRQISWACGGGDSPLSCMDTSISKIYSFAEDSSNDLFLSTNMGILKVVNEDRCPALYCGELNPTDLAPSQDSTGNTEMTSSGTLSQSTSGSSGQSDTSTNSGSSLTSDQHTKIDEEESSSTVVGSTSQGVIASILLVILLTT